MAPTAKRRRRLVVLAAAVAGLAVLGAAAYQFRSIQLDRRAWDYRKSGRAAADRKDWVAALDGFGRFLQRHGEEAATAEDFLYYARARRAVEMPNGKHLTAAIGTLRAALDRNPGARELEDDLLQLYLDTGYTTEALGLLDQMIGESPADIGLLARKADVLAAVRRTDEALAVARRMNETAPNDFAGFVRTLELLLMADTAPAALDVWTDEVVKSHAADGRFEIFRAAVLARRGDRAAAKEVLDRVVASAHDSDDAVFVQFCLDELDRAERSGDALALIERIADASEPAIRSEILQRLWFAGRVEDVLARAERWSEQPATASSEVVAMRALALGALGRADEADALAKGLAERDDAAARAWSALVGSATMRGRTPTLADVEALDRAAGALRTSALVRQALGDARAALGERDAAVASWSVAAALARSWARPLVSIAGAYMGEPGREAVAAARAGLLRAPNDLDAINTYVQALARSADEVDAEQRGRLLGAIAEIRKQAPDRVESLVAVETDLLLGTDPAEAQRRLREFLTAPTPAREETLLRLAALAERAGLALANEFLDLSERVHGATPRLALARAVSRAQRTDAATGLRAFDEVRARAPASAAAAADWDLSRASFLDANRLPEAREAWLALASAREGDLQVQLGALASPAVWTDRAGTDLVIERVRALTGDGGVTWRVARGRWILANPDAEEKDVAVAATLLGDVVRDAPRSVLTRMLLAEAMEKLRNVAQAEEHLRSAAELAPDNPWIALELARLAQKQGQTDAAGRQIERALKMGDLPAAQAERAAYLLAAQGDLRRGAEILEPIATRAGARRDGVLLLARLWARLGEYDRAVALCQRLLTSPDAEILLFAADLHAAAGRPADAEAMLLRLGRSSSAPGDVELARARHARKWGRPAEALDWFRKAVAAAPQRADARAALAEFAVASGDVATAESVVRETEPGTSDAVDYLRSVGDLLARATEDVRLRPLVMVAMGDAKARPALDAALRAVVVQGRDPAQRAATARTVATLAESHPNVLALQLLGARVSAEAGNPGQACEIARVAQTRFPNSIAAAALAAELLAHADRWDDAAKAARAWVDRTGPQDVYACRSLALALLRTDRPADACAALDGVARVAMTRPDDHSEVLVARLVALTRSGRAAEATGLLAELVQRDARWRTTFLGASPAILGDGASALVWLRMCEPHVPADSPPAQLALARAWGGAWERFRTLELSAGARRVLDALIARGDASADALWVAANLAEQRGEVEVAEAGYRAALAKDPRHLAAMNNLAMILANTGRWKDGVPLARAVAEASPRDPNALDTWAQVVAKGGDHVAAADLLQRAVDLDPATPEWRVGLVEALTGAGSTEKARRELDRLESLLAQLGPTEPRLRGRLDEVRRSLR